MNDWTRIGSGGIRCLPAEPPRWNGSTISYLSSCVPSRVVLWRPDEASLVYPLALYQVYVLSQPACTQSLNLWLKSVQVVAAAAAAFADPRPIPFLSLFLS